MKGQIYPAPEFGNATRQSDKAWIDFFVPVYNWGYEWLRDGSEIAAHCRRFEGNGKYKRWLDSGDMTDYLLLDFRSTVPREPHPRKYYGIAHGSRCFLQATDRLIREFRIPQALPRMF